MATKIERQQLALPKCSDASVSARIVGVSRSGYSQNRTTADGARVDIFTTVRESTCTPDGRRCLLCLLWLWEHDPAPTTLLANQGDFIDMNALTGEVI